MIARDIVTIHHYRNEMLRGKDAARKASEFGHDDGDAEHIHKKVRTGEHHGRTHAHGGSLEEKVASQRLGTEPGGKDAELKKADESDLERKLNSDDDDVKTEDEDEEISTKRKTFPERLMELLNSDENKDAMWWLPEGDSFAIHTKTFTATILNRYFQGTKLESFTRKLNRWGFKRVAGQRVPPNAVAYYHNLFQKEQPELVKRMNGGKKKHNDARDSFVRRELYRDLGLLNVSQPVGPVVHLPVSVTTVVPVTSNLVAPSVASALVQTLNPTTALLEQQLRARADQDLAVRNAVAVLNQQQQLRAVQQQFLQASTVAGLGGSLGVGGGVSPASAGSAPLLVGNNLLLSSLLGQASNRVLDPTTLQTPEHVPSTTGLGAVLGQSADQTVRLQQAQVGHDQLNLVLQLQQQQQQIRELLQGGNQGTRGRDDSENNNVRGL